MSDQPKRGRGRPPLPAEEGKRWPLSIRITKQVDDKLRAYAKRSGRSIAFEAELRLERSFELDAAPEFRPMLYLILKLFMERGMTAAPDQPPDEWMQNRTVFKVAMLGALEGLWLMCPGDPVTWEEKRGWHEYGRQRAESVILSRRDLAEREKQAQREGRTLPLPGSITVTFDDAGNVVDVTPAGEDDSKSAA